MCIACTILISLLEFKIKALLPITINERFFHEDTVLSLYSRVEVPIPQHPPASPSWNHGLSGELYSIAIRHEDSCTPNAFCKEVYGCVVYNAGSVNKQMKT